MNFIGVDLHKKSITICVMDEKRKLLARKALACTQTNEIVEFFRQFRPFKVVVEATASYLWFVELVEPWAEKVVLANPKKLRVIAESTNKTDRLGCPGPDRISGPGHDPRVLPAHAPAAAAPGLGPPPPVSPGPDYLGPQQDPTHPQQLQRRPQRPVLGELRPGLPQGDPPQRRGSVCDQTALGRMAGPPGSAAGGEQEAQGLRGQGAAAGSRGPGDPQDRPGGGPRDGRGGPQRAGRHQPIPQRQDCLCLRGTGAGGTAERGEEVQGPEDYQGRLGTVAVGTGGGRLATGRQQPEMGCPVRSVDASQR